MICHDLLVLYEVELIFLRVANAGPVFWICAEKSVDNTRMFSLQLSHKETQ